MSLSKRSLRILGIVVGVALIIAIVALLIGRNGQATLRPLLETSQQVTKGQDNIVTLGDGLRVELPAGSIFQESDTLTIASYQNPPHGNQGSLGFVGRFYDIDLDGGEFFNGPGKLEIPYEEADIPRGYTEDEVFAIYSAEGEWHRLYGDVNSEENTITVYTIHNGFWSTAIDKVSNFIGDVADFFSGRTSDYSDIEAARENVRMKRTEFLQTFEAFESAVDSEPVGILDIDKWAIENLVETVVIQGLETPVVAYAGTTVLAGKIIVAGAIIGDWVGLAGGALYLMVMAEDTGEIAALRIRLEIALDRLQEAEGILWALEHPEALTLSPNHQKALEDYIAALPISQTISITTPIDFTVSAYPYPTEGEEPSDTFTLTISSSSGGSVTTPGVGAFTRNGGAAVNLVATPGSGYRFVNWTGDVDTIDDVGDASTTIWMNGDYSITANFEEDVCILTISSTAGGSLTIPPREGEFFYECGDVGSLVATPNSGYRFVNWTGDVDTIGDVNDPTTTITMNDNYSITAHFEVLPEEECTLTISSTAGGAVTIPPGEGEFFYECGDVGSLVATPNSGYRFVNWTGDVDTIGDVNDPTTTITMNDDYSITANFEAEGVVQPPDTTVIAAGGSHTVGLESDGTVVAVGYNGYGECNVEGWTNIVQVAAAGWVTVGLKSDGTAVAEGWNEEGTCDVGGWTDIMQVAAGGWHTVGLKADGTVVAVGDNDFGQCDVGGWTNIIQVDGGFVHTVGVKADGTVVAVGINSDGQCNVGGWTNIIQVVAGTRHTVGIRADGTVVAVGDNGYGQCNVGGWANVIQVAAGVYHTVGLKADGTVVAVGDNDFGQCDVGGWDLN